MKAVFARESFFSAPREELFAFHERPDAFAALTPPWSGVEVLETVSTLAPSDERARFVTRFLFLRFAFEMAHTVYEPPARFVDEQRAGLFTSWRHEHRFAAAGGERMPAALLRDEIRFAHPLLFLFKPFVTGRLGRLFEFRHAETARALREGAAGRTLAGRRIAITGATGLLGRRLGEVLREQGAAVIGLVRDVERARRRLDPGIELVRFDFHHPEDGDWRARLDGVDGVVHLAGTPLFARRWTASFKQEMEASRVEGTRQIVEAIAAATRRPPVLVTASAIGIYGNDPRREVDEDTPPGDDLLARICERWEAAARPVEEAGVRLVLPRLGIVLSRRSGALKEMLLPFRLGLGGVFGRPEPFINWIHLEDAVRIIALALVDERLSGPYNLVAPAPVDNATYARTLARVLGRPALLRYPAGLLRALIGPAAEYASGGPRVASGRLDGAGYRFFYEELEPALRNALGRP